MFKNKKVLLLVALAMLVSTVLTACGGGSDIDVSDKTELIIANGADAPTLDPHGKNDNVSSQINGQIYSRLIYFDEDMEIQPDIATEWEQVDDLNWEFTIREGVKFHNGDELMPEDVKFSLDRHMSSPEVSHTLEAIDEVTVLDNNRVQITTKRPFAALEAHLGHSSVAMLNERSVTEIGEDFGQKPVGSGPFKFKDWIVGDSITLEKFDDYYGESPKVETMVFRNIQEGTNRTIALETGEVDLVIDIDPTDKGRVMDNDDLEYLEGPGFGVDYIGFNVAKEPFDDIRVRKAINYAINVEEIVDVVMEGTAKVAQAPLQEDAFGANTELEAYEYNPEKAKELLAEAGYPNGFETTIVTNDSGLRISIAEMVQAHLKDVGIDLNVDIMEWGKYLEVTGGGHHEMFILGWTNSTGDAENGLASRYLTENHGDAGNRMFYSNEKVDELIKSAGGEKDQEKRSDLYKEAQVLIMEDAPDVLIMNKLYTFGMQKYVKGFRPHPSGANDYSGIYFEE